ncbi:hypothetical protein DENSPDRAFT_865060 [Dentipellis sp. KUC8613]|nr:hypothetical protein DENSPDRAFT_865060 [Dentipellis sp. KUC8613]
MSAIDMQEAIKMLREIRPAMDPEEEYLTIAAAEEQMSKRAVMRKKELEEAHAHLKALSRILDAARTSSKRPPNVPSAEQHAEHLNDLDATRLSLAKAINDAESEQASKEAELARLKEEAQALEESDPAAEAERELDSTALRLQIYKGLGFQPVLDKQGRLKNIIVEGKLGHINVIPADKGGPSVEKTNLLWKLASS